MNAIALLKRQAATWVDSAKRWQDLADNAISRGDTLEASACQRIADQRLQWADHDEQRAFELQLKGAVN